MTDSQTGVTIEEKIRWGDMDALGHVNNTVFFRFCESARIAYFEAVKLNDHQSKASDGPGMVACNLNFRRQLKYPGRVSIQAKTSKIGRKSFTLEYLLRDCADQEIVADGSSVLVWVDYENAKAMPLPEALVETIVALEQKPELKNQES